jgi:hypothetical protein
VTPDEQAARERLLHDTWVAQLRCKVDSILNESMERVEKAIALALDQGDYRALLPLHDEYQAYLRTAVEALTQETYIMKSMAEVRHHIEDEASEIIVRWEQHLQDTFGIALMFGRCLAGYIQGLYHRLVDRGIVADDRERRELLYYLVDKCHTFAAGLMELLKQVSAYLPPALEQVVHDWFDTCGQSPVTRVIATDQTAEALDRIRAWHVRYVATRTQIQDIAIEGEPKFQALEPFQARLLAHHYVALANLMYCPTHIALLEELHNIADPSNPVADLLAGCLRASVEFDSGTVVVPGAIAIPLKDDDLDLRSARGRVVTNLLVLIPLLEELTMLETIVHHTTQTLNGKVK